MSAWGAPEQQDYDIGEPNPPAMTETAATHRCTTECIANGGCTWQRCDRGAPYVHPHAFEPGVDIDTGESSLEWCNVCGETVTE